MDKRSFFGAIVGTMVTLAVVLGTVVWSGTITRPIKGFGGTEWQTGQSFTAADANNDVNTIYNWLNGANIGDANIDATGITTRDKLPTALTYEDESNTFTNTNIFGDDVNIDLGTITVVEKALDATATWNEDATTFDLLFGNVTDTASASASRLLDLQVGGSSVFAVRKDGVMILPTGQVAYGEEGTFTTGSISPGNEDTRDVAHTLGTDLVMVIASSLGNSGTGTDFTKTDVQWARPDGQHGSGLTVDAKPATANIRFNTTNAGTASGAQTMTVNYWIIPIGN